MLTGDLRQTWALVCLQRRTAFVAPEVRCDVCRRRAHAWDLSALRGPSPKLDRGTTHCSPDKRAEPRHHHAKAPVPVYRSNNANQGATQQSGFVSLQIELTRNNETASLVLGAHVSNVP